MGSGVWAGRGGGVFVLGGCFLGREGRAGLGGDMFRPGMYVLGGNEGELVTVRA